MKHLYRIILVAALAALCFSSASAQNKTRAKFVELPKEHGEICLGLTIQPQVLFSNVTASTQHLKAQITIVNAVTGQSIYSSSLNILNVPANSDTLVTFPNFITNINDPKFLGRHVVTAIGSSMTSGGVITPDTNPADDTLKVTVFGTRRTQMPYDDHFAAYTVTTTGLVVPTATKWVSAGVTVVDGEVHTFDPPGPTDPDAGYGTMLFTAPVVKLDRRNVNGVMYSDNGSGDTLTSFPINLLGASNINLSFDYHRSNKRTYAFAYDRDTMYGPEHTIRNALGSTTRAGDSLILEFKNPSESACNPSSGSWMRMAAIDAGKDLEWQRFFVSVDSKNKVNLNFFNADFRFRIRLKAKNDALSPKVDDDDAWYIDNIRLSTPVAEPQTRVNWVRVVSPYTKVPSRQAFFPVYVKITNDASTLSSQAVQLVVQITGTDGTPKYHQVKFVQRPAVGRDTVIQFPHWDATNTMISPFDREIKVQAWIHAAGFETYTAEYDAYSSFFMNVEPGSSVTQEFAYDDAGINPAINSGNDYPMLTGLTGQGVGFNNSTGSFAVRFDLNRRDTVYGVRIYFASANSAPDAIRISLHDGSPQTAIPGALVSPAATFDAERRGDQFNKFWPYYFPEPIVIPGVVDGDDGIYWMSVGQLSLDNMAMGADISRRGTELRVDDIQPTMTFIHRSPYATQYAAESNAGDITNVVAYRFDATNGPWHSYTATTGLTGTNEPFAWTGNYIPMIRPLVGRRALLPVAFAQQLKAELMDGKAVLTWVTATEKDNHGFRIERKQAGSHWADVGFVRSRSTNSSTPSGYTFEDAAPVSGRVTYRLVQIDLDGSESLSNEAEVFVGGDATGAVTVYPNPFIAREQNVVIAFDNAAGLETPITITNMLGQTVRSMLTTSNSVKWNGKDDSGNALSAGSYVVSVNGMTSVISLR